MRHALDAITIALVWHEERQVWHAQARQLYYAGLDDRRAVVVETHDALLLHEPRLAGPLDFTIVNVDRLLNTPHQPWHPEQPQLFTSEDRF